MGANRETLDLSRLESGEKRRVERFLDSIEAELLEKFPPERARGILGTFRGDLHNLINDRVLAEMRALKEGGMSLSELCLEESQVPLEPTDDEAQSELEILIDSFFQRLSTILSESSNLDN